MRYISEMVLRIGRCLSPGVGVVAGMCLAALIALTGCDIELPVLQQETEVVLPPDETVQREVEAQPTPQSGVKTVKVERGPITQILRSSGRVAPSLEQTLYFLSSGQMTTMYVDTKEQVEAGTLMAELDTEGLQHQRLKVLEAVERAQVQLDQARAKKVSTDTAREAADAEAARIRMELARSDLESFEQGLDTVALRSAEAAVAKAQADLDRLTNDLATRQIALEAAQATLAAAWAGAGPAGGGSRGAPTGRSAVATGQSPGRHERGGHPVGGDRARRSAHQIEPTPRRAAGGSGGCQRGPPHRRAGPSQSGSGGGRAPGGGPRRSACRPRRASGWRNWPWKRPKTAWPKCSPAARRRGPCGCRSSRCWALKMRCRRLQQVQPLDIRVAELVVEQAQANLAAAQQGPSGDAVRRLRYQITQRQRAVEAVEAAFPSAEAALESAKLRLAELQEGDGGRRGVPASPLPVPSSGERL